MCQPTFSVVTGLMFLQQVENDAPHCSHKFSQTVTPSKHTVADLNMQGETQSIPPKPMTIPIDCQHAAVDMPQV